MNITSKRFEELTLHELYEILRARSEVFVVEQNIIYQDMDEIDFRATHLFATDSESGHICSYLRIIDAGVKYPEVSIGRVLTLKPFRGKGISRLLMEEAIRVAFTHCDAIKIEAQAYLQNFYLSLGFQPTTDIFILENIPHIEMILRKS